MNLSELQLAAEMGQLQGLIPGVASEDYHHKDSPGVSSSFLKKIISSTPMHAIASLEEKEDSDALVFGRAFHTILDSEDIFNQTHITVPEGMRRDLRAKAYQEFMAENKGKVILSRDEFDTLRRMRDTVAAHPLYSLTRGGKCEHSGYWTDEETGVLCKIRPDVLLDDGLVFDWKSCGKPINPYSFSKVVHEYGYHVSGAMYLAGLSKILGIKLRHFVLVAVEKQKPNGVIFYDIDPAAIEKGEEDFRHALAIYKNCKETNEWPGYPTDFEPIGLPAYAFSLNA